MNNKYQEALDKLYDGYKNGMAGRHYYDILQELVDKEKPMKPKTKKYGRGSEWVCPNCKSHIAYFDDLGIGTVPVMKYCRDCGQRLDLGGERV